MLSVESIKNAFQSTVQFLRLLITKKFCTRVVKYAYVHINIINKFSFRKRQTVASVCAALLNANGISVFVKDCLSCHGTCLYCCNKCILNLSV